MRDEDGFVWIGVHFGSRGLGHTSATQYLKAAGGKDGMNVPPAVIDEDSEIGRRYIAAMELRAAIPTPAANGSSSASARSSAATSPTWCTTTTTTLGAKTTTAGICGWFARARRPPSPASAVLSAARWATTR